MRYARKIMISAPKEQVTRALQNVLLTRNITQSKLQALEENMKNILARTDLPDDAKVSMYQQALHHYLQYDHARRIEPVSVTMSAPKSANERYTENEPLSDRSVAEPDRRPIDDLTPQILQSIPKPFQRKAALLIGKLKNNDVMSWNNNGELIYDGDVVKGSNVIDLVNDVLKSKKGFDPHGWQHFAQGLARANAPESVIGNVLRRTAVRQYKQLGSTHKRLLPTPPSLHTTPRRIQRRRKISSRPITRTLWETM